ncbi:MAG: primosomal protein N', partial [Planctomycetota bacterium]
MSGIVTRRGASGYGRGAADEQRRVNLMDGRQFTLFDPGFDPAPWDHDELADAAVAEVVFASPPYGPFHYLISEDLRDRVELGRRVRVPLGRGGRDMVGYCVGLTRRAGDVRTLKLVISVVDPKPLFGPPLLDLAQWIANRYLSPLGNVLESVIPAGVRAQAGTREQRFLTIPPEFVEQIEELPVTAKQRAILRTVRDTPRSLTAKEIGQLASCSTAPIERLREKGWLVDELRRVQWSVADDLQIEPESPLELGVDQQRAFDTIAGDLKQQRSSVVLLHGVTGSGKTEVYIRAIEEVIRVGRQAIVLVPEISLTPQTRQRFRARFPRVAVLHSHQSDAERNAHWQQIMHGDVQVVEGARSAVFAPTPRLGLIVIDEEHDGSFKQDSQPRYPAREVARRRCEAAGIPLVLGSATPSLESWQRAQSGDYQLVELPQRVSQRALPQVTTVDLRTELRGSISRSSISRTLSRAIEETVRDDGQVILLLNRRGYATSIQCSACGYVAKCPDCDLVLTLHRAANVASCHYCDYQLATPQRCPQCRFDGFRLGGLGTERLEAELHSRFPGVSLLRMDADTMQKPGSHEAALAKFRAGEARILVGTQMIAKGLDFPNVTLVGVINADAALHFPDFRAAERTFQ